MVSIGPMGPRPFFEALIGGQACLDMHLGDIRCRPCSDVVYVMNFVSQVSKCRRNLSLYSSI